jgi:hypothetical protein
MKSWRIIIAALAALILPLCVVQPAFARAKLIGVFPIRSTHALAADAERLRRMIVSRLSQIDGYDAREIAAPSNGSLGAAAATADVVDYVSGQLIAADGGYELTLGSFEVATDAPVGHYTALLASPRALPNQPEIVSLVEMPQTNLAASLVGQPCPTQSYSPRDLRIEVVNAWQRGVQGAFEIHDRIVIYGGAADERVTPCDFVLTVALANGLAKSFTGASSASEQDIGKFAANMLNPFAGFWAHHITPEVDPKEDLGGMGSLVVPSRGSVKTVVTFLVPEFLLDPKAPETNVTLKSPATP